MAVTFSGTWIVEPHVIGGYDTKEGIAKLTMPASWTADGEDITTALSLSTHFDEVYGAQVIGGTVKTTPAFNFGFSGTAGALGKGLTSLKMQCYWSADGTDGEKFVEAATADLTTDCQYVWVKVWGYKA